MRFTVEIIDVHGVRQGEPWSHSRSGELLGQATAGTCCLRILDPYGDAVFNQLQLPILLSELAAFHASLPDGELVAVGETLDAFLRQALDRPHTYVRFLGD